MGTKASPNERARLEGPERPTSTDLVAASRSTETLRATKVDGIARPSRLERQKSTDNGTQEGPRRDVRRFRLDFESIFVVFRGNIARAT